MERQHFVVLIDPVGRGRKTEQQPPFSCSLGRAEGEERHVRRARNARVRREARSEWC